jgi:hypothetical protein
LGSTDKRVILFYRRDVEQKVSLLITGNRHANCTLAPYATLGEVEEFIAAHVASGFESA